MANPTQRSIVNAALHEHPHTFADELGGGGIKNTPSSLYRLLCFAHLASTRIRHDIAVAAARALFRNGWTTPRRMLDTDWGSRVKVLNHAGYARYDESTAERLAYNAELLIKEYRGDLRRLRDAADGDPADMRRRLKAFKGIGDVGVDIFFRDAQAVWDELYPFADRVALRAADHLGLPDSAKALAGLVEDDPLRFAHLLATLVRIELDKEHEHIRAAAA
ncbi:MAG: hypothetical protein WD009_02425 [Phycisphaeraceae bacterium]